MTETDEGAPESAVECDHDWWLPDPGGAPTADHPWQLWCRRCDGRTSVCDLCLSRPRLDGSAWCAVCRPRIRASFPSFEEMLTHPWMQPDELVYPNPAPSSTIDANPPKKRGSNSHD